jgi:small-conductance mechanosensitive channel
MSKRQKTTAVVLVLLLAGAAYGLFRTNEPRLLSNTDSTDRSSNIQSGYVDQTPLQTAQRLASLASGEDEQPLAKEGLRLADHEVDLAFATALRNAAQHPPTLNPEARERQAVLSEAESALERDKAEVARLTEGESKAEGEKKISANDQLEIAKAQLELDEDEVEDAKQDLMRSGGDPQGRIQAMVQEHEAVLHDTPVAGAGANADAAQKAGLVRRVQQWISLRQRLGRLRQAQGDASAAAVALSGKHDALIALVGEKKAGVTQQLEKTDLEAEPPSNTAASAGHPIAGKPTATTAGTTTTKEKPVVRSHQQAAVVVKVTKERSAQQNELATYDKRVETYKDLAAVYDKWSTLVAAKQRSTLRRAIWGFTIILFILLLAIFFSTWMERLLGRLPLARRQVDTLRAVMRLSLQIFAVLLTLLVIFGPPGQLGTFLGLAGAGLTVALKDFIVSFVGWFVLMGRNGIRLGDWVEINGVSGEVVELGMFHTVLLETGNWTDSGHPTGRRVTFTNSFAIEGHYFNFSTSGQWMWDELQIVLPAGKDPFPIVDAIQKKVVEATAESTELAEKEWQRAARSRDMSALSAAPAINVRPVIGGVELGVRYITRANERYQLRGKLYGVAMDLLASKNIPRPGSTDTGATVKIRDGGPVDNASVPNELVSTKS